MGIRYGGFLNGLCTVIIHARWMCCHTEDYFDWKRENIWAKVFHRIFTKDLGGKKKKGRKPNDSKELNHPVDILGFHLGGSSAVVFCTTDSQCVYGTLLSLDLCMFSSQTNLVRNWQMQGVKYWLCLCARANVAARRCVCACVRACFWLLSWFHLSVLPRRRKPLPSASCSKFLCVPNKRQEVEFKSNFYRHTGPLIKRSWWEEENFLSTSLTHESDRKNPTVNWQSDYVTDVSHEKHLELILRYFLTDGEWCKEEREWEEEEKWCSKVRTA